ncbi:hypothetical protein GPA22_00860 [Aromatoleum toluvorans]|uniref:Uncharacterized protein n=1 Tax=Aromatoleum toluvorans TaxID=92002 RepID=A0ABX1PS78_9RHOO|nr:hypothetical protein [Aromatoleum toluvorans]NMG42287.1 hypothetical protein [Aromatoleum toluvorans]
MTDWLRDHQANRTQPRLWVERLWLLESREPLVVVRTVNLRPGVNVVWAREPETDAASGLASAGHSVGKTSFCLLLRYCLGDEAPSINALREKAVAGFPKGGVAAKVHLDGTAWVVYRSYGLHAQSLAGRGDSLESLLAGELDGSFQDFLDSLNQAFIGKLSATTLPGSNQVLEWRHLLAWCIRDQKTRFDAFFHWRDGDGLGFRRPRQDPPMFVRSILGVHDRELDVLMRDVEATQAALNAIDAELPELERLPAYALTIAEQHLRARLGVDDEVPIFRGTVGPSLQEIMEQRFRDGEKGDEQIEREVAAAEELLTPELVRLADLTHVAKIREMERQVAQTLVDNNEKEFNRLSAELSELDRLAGHCRYGDVDFSRCDHIVSRRSTASLTWRLRRQGAEADMSRFRLELAQSSERASVAQAAATAQEAVVSQKRAAVRRLQMRRWTNENQRDSLRDQWNELLLHLRQRDEGNGTAELVRAKARRAELVAEADHKQAEVIARRLQRSERGEAVKALTHIVASRLLGESGYGLFRPDSDIRPFELNIGGEAYQVLEVLLGDITSLLDAAMSTSSQHPGFVVHDCPREADMSERLYREFLLMVAEAEEQLGRDGGVPFQYIVTTTSPPPEQLRAAPFLVLELRPGAEDGLLFKRRLLPELPGV